jgi:DNA invertase Pin-like site-specific DNA recombinase
MTNTLIGYARCSTDKQDLTAQRQALIELGVPEDRIYTDHGLTGRNRDRPGLAQALAAVRAGETLVVPKLDRLARSVPDARAIADELEKRGVSLALGKQVYDPNDPMGRMFFNILATFAEFESDLIRMRTREGMKIARDKGKLRGKALICSSNAMTLSISICLGPHRGWSSATAASTVSCNPLLRFSAATLCMSSARRTLFSRLWSGKPI